MSRTNTSVRIPILHQYLFSNNVKDEDKQRRLVSDDDQNRYAFRAGLSTLGNPAENAVTGMEYEVTGKEGGGPSVEGILHYPYYCIPH